MPFGVGLKKINYDYQQIAQKLNGELSKDSSIFSILNSNCNKVLDINDLQNTRAKFMLDMIDLNNNGKIEDNEINHLKKNQDKIMEKYRSVGQISHPGYETKYQETQTFSYKEYKSGKRPLGIESDYKNITDPNMIPEGFKFYREGKDKYYKRVNPDNSVSYLKVYEKNGERMILRTEIDPANNKCSRVFTHMKLKETKQVKKNQQVISNQPVKSNQQKVNSDKPVNLNVIKPHIMEMVKIQAKLYNLEKYGYTPEKLVSSVIKISEEMSKKYNCKIDPNLILCQIYKESEFNPEARSKCKTKFEGKTVTGAFGLMQLIPSTAKGLGIDVNLGDLNKLYDIETNLRGGIEYFAIMLKATKGDPVVALGCYNGGIGRIPYRLKHGIPLPQETRIYMDRIQKYLNGTSKPWLIYKQS